MNTRPVLERIEDFAGLPASAYDEAAEQAVRQAAAIGRPLMDEATMRRWEQSLDRPILPRKRGPKPKSG